MTLASFVPGPPPQQDDEEQDEALHPGAGLDPATGLPLLLRSKCTTCIYRPGNLMHLTAGRRTQMEDDAIARWSWITCHSTLPYHPSHSGWQAICRGFHDVRGRESIGIRLALLYGGPIEIDLPPQEESIP